MVKRLHAVYEHGILRPLEPIDGIEENAEVELTLSIDLSIEKKGIHPILRFAGILKEEEADQMMKAVDDEFERVNPDEWKD